MPITLMIDGETVIVEGRMRALVESKSIADTWHVVEVDESEGNRIECSCRGFEIRKTCRHANMLRRWLMGTADVRFREDPDEEGAQQ
jgi:hypothetical protein